MKHSSIPYLGFNRGYGKAALFLTAFCAPGDEPTVCPPTSKVPTKTIDLPNVVKAMYPTVEEVNIQESSVSSTPSSEICADFDKGSISERISAMFSVDVLDIPIKFHDLCGLNDIVETPLVNSVIHQCNYMDQGLDWYDTVDVNSVSIPTKFNCSSQGCVTDDQCNGFYNDDGNEAYIIPSDESTLSLIHI